MEISKEINFAMFTLVRFPIKDMSLTKSIFAIRLFLLIYLLGLNQLAVSAQTEIDQKHILEDFHILKQTLEELHPDIYRYTSQNKFDAKGDSILKALQPGLNPIEFYLSIAPYVTQIKNGHTAIRLPQKLCDTLMVLPLRLIAFEGKFYVNESLVEADDSVAGLEIKRINNVQVEEVVLKSLPYVSADGENNVARVKAVVEDDLALYYALLYGGSKKFLIEFLDSRQQPRKVEMSGISYHEFLEKYDQREEFPWSISKIDSLTAAVITIRSFNNFSYYDGKKLYFDKTLEAFFRQINKWKVKNLILDIRFNGGGELKNAILLYKYLASAPFQFAKHIEMASITPPTYVQFTNYESALKYGPINKKHNQKTSEKVYEVSGHFSQEIQRPKKGSFTGKLIVLINGNTASAAGALASCVKNATRGLIVGEENHDNYTGFSAGVPVILTLPNSRITVSIPIRKFTYANGKDTGRGVAPDYLFPSTARDYFGNDDLLLEFAAKLLKD